MAIAMSMEWPEATQELYDRIMEALGLDADPPEGALLHIAGIEGGSLRVVDVWESEDAWNTFLGGRLMKAVEQVGIPGQPKVTIYHVHNVYVPDLDALGSLAGMSSLAG